MFLKKTHLTLVSNQLLKPFASNWKSLLRIPLHKFLLMRTCNRLLILLQKRMPQLWLAIPDSTRIREGIKEKIKQIAGLIQTIVGATRTLTQIAQAIKGTGPLRQPMILIMIMIAVAKDQSIQTIVIPTIPLMRLY